MASRQELDHLRLHIDAVLNDNGRRDAGVARKARLVSRLVRDATPDTSSWYASLSVDLGNVGGQDAASLKEAIAELIGEPTGSDITALMGFIEIGAIRRG